MSVGVFIVIVYIMQIIGGMYVSWCFHWYCANNFGDSSGRSGKYGESGESSEYAETGEYGKSFESIEYDKPDESPEPEEPYK